MSGNGINDFQFENQMLLSAKKQRNINVLNLRRYEKKFILFCRTQFPESSAHFVYVFLHFSSDFC